MVRLSIECFCVVYVFCRSGRPTAWAPWRRVPRGESAKQNATQTGIDPAAVYMLSFNVFNGCFYKYINKYHWHFSMVTLSSRINVPLDTNERFGCESVGDIHGSAPGWWDSVLWARPCVKHIRNSTGLREWRAWLCLHGAAKSSEGRVRPEYSSPSLLMLTQAAPVMGPKMTPNNFITWSLFCFFHPDIHPNIFVNGFVFLRIHYVQVVHLEERKNYLDAVQRIRRDYPTSISSKRWRITSESELLLMSCLPFPTLMVKQKLSRFF